MLYFDTVWGNKLPAYQSLSSLFCDVCGFYRSSSQVVRGILRIKALDITTGDGLIYQDVYYL